MRIAFLAPYHPFRGGIAQITAIFAHSLKKRNHEIKVFSFIKQYPDSIFPGKDQFTPSENPIPVNSERILTPYNPFTWYSAYKKIRDWNPDVLIIKYWIPFFAPSYWFVSLLLRKFTNVEIIYNTDNIISHEKWPIGNWLTKKALSQANYILTLSKNVTETAYKLLPKFPKENIFTGLHPNYDFYQHFKITNKKDLRDKYHITSSKVILFFGFIKKYKGLDLLLDAMPRIVSKLPDLQLLIAGETYGDPQEYYDMIKEKNLTAFVRFENRFINDEEVTEIFSITDVAVQPYRSATQSGISQVAFSLNTPVIATNVGGLFESIHHNETGLLADAANPMAIADAVIEFYENNRKEEFEQNIIKSKDKFAWKPLLDLLENIVKKS